MTGYESRSEFQAEAGSGGDDAVDRFPGWHGVEARPLRRRSETVSLVVSRAPTTAW